MTKIFQTATLTWSRFLISLVPILIGMYVGTNAMPGDWLGLLVGGTLGLIIQLGAIRQFVNGVTGIIFVSQVSHGCAANRRRPEATVTISQVELVSHNCVIGSQSHCLGTHNTAPDSRSAG